MGRSSSHDMDLRQAGHPSKDGGCSRLSTDVTGDVFTWSRPSTIAVPPLPLPTPRPPDPPAAVKTLYFNTATRHGVTSDNTRVNTWFAHHGWRLKQAATAQRRPEFDTLGLARLATLGSEQSNRPPLPCRKTTARPSPRGPRSPTLYETNADFSRPAPPLVSTLARTDAMYMELPRNTHYCGASRHTRTISCCRTVLPSALALHHLG